MRNPWELLAYPAHAIEPRITQVRTPKLKVGEVVHRWTLLAYLPGRRIAPRVEAKWRCVCECGAVRLVQSTNLLRGGSRSCGHDRNVGGYGRKLNSDL